MTFSPPSAQVLNPLIDAADTLLSVQSADDAWLKSVALVKQNGGNALNVAEFDAATGAPIWFRSAMKSEWLEDYLAQDFVACDPLLLSARRGLSSVRMVDGSVAGLPKTDQCANALADQVNGWGYGTIDFHVFAAASSVR